MRRFEFLIADVSKARLTVAVDRVTVKVPRDTDEDMQDRINRFACKVAEQIDYPSTVRGVIKFNTKYYDGLTTLLYHTKIKKGSRVREKIFTFKEGEI